MAGGVVYLVTCTVTGKHYVGQTIRSVEERWTQHLYLAGPGRFESPLHRAIRRYGPGAFQVRVLEIVVDRADLNQLEAHYAAVYEALVPRGYGLRVGNAMGSAFSSLTIQRMSAAAKLRAQAPGWRERQRAVQTIAQARPEVRVRKALAISEVWRDETYRQKQTAARAQASYRLSDSALRKHEWANQETRASHLAGLIAAKPRIAAASRERWSDPDYRSRLSDSQRAAWEARKKRREGRG